MDKEILRLAVPNIITNITVPLLAMADTAIAGHLPSFLYIGAVSAAGVIFNFLYWNFSFLRMGTSGFAAQAVGANNEQECVNVLMRALFTAVSAGVILILLQGFIFKAAFFFLQASPQTQALAAEYFFIYIWSAPFALAMFAFTGWFIGMQNAKVPMVISISANVVNIICSLLFVFVFRLNIKGIALGSLAAQIFAFILSAFIWFKFYGKLKKYVSFEVLKSVRGFAAFFKVNRDIFLRSFALIAVTVFFTSVSARSGDIYLSANNLLMQFQSDILDVAVERPMVSETTALGAAYLAGLAVGFWKNKEELRANYLVDRTFVPQINDEKRGELVDGWKRAVRATCDF